MSEQPSWIMNEEAASIEKWTEYLHAKAREMFLQDGTHAPIIFSFSKEEGLISVNMVPPETDEEQVDKDIINLIQEYDLFGVILIGEAWAYVGKENDHTLVQLLDGEMKVSELRDEDKKDILYVRMENKDGHSMTYSAQIIKDESGTTLAESTISHTTHKKWIQADNYVHD